MSLDYFVKLFTVCRRYVFHISHILQSTLNLERSGPSLCKSFKIVYLAEVFQRQQVSVVFHHLSLRVHEVELQSAELCTLSPVGRARETILRCITLSAIAHTQSPMNKHLKFHLRQCLVNGVDFLYRQFSGQHHSVESESCEPFHLFFCSVVSLCACMQFHFRPILLHFPYHFSKSHVLHEHSIDPSPVQLFEQDFHVVNFIVVNNGVNGEIHLDTELVGISAQFLYVRDRISGSGPCPKHFSTNIHGVCPMVDSRHSTLQVFCRSKQFKFSYHL